MVLVETGRQPIDNPDTHLELTMIHEGPLLEYAGRDLAYLHWAAAARHWLMLDARRRAVPARTRAASRGGLAALAAGVAACCAWRLAVTETAQAKMRILRVPSLLGLGSVVALVGVGAWIAGGAA